jgi:Zonular occludens toxin (Zot)
MLEIHSGKVGGGKSYMGTDAVVEALSNHRPVVTNLAIFPCKIAHYLTRKDGFKLGVNHHTGNKLADWRYNRLGLYRSGFSPYYIRFNHYFSLITMIGAYGSEEKRRWELEHFWVFGMKGSLLVLDEIHEYFYCRDTTKRNDELQKRLLSYLSQHRHFGDDLIVITQNVNNIDLQFRRLASHFVHWNNYKDISFFKWAGNIPLIDKLQKMAPMQFMGNYYNGEKAQSPFKYRMITPNKTIFGLYDTHGRRDNVNKVELRNAILKDAEYLKGDESAVCGSGSVPAASGSSGGISYVEHYGEYTR